MRYTTPTSREHAQGIILLLLVSLLWVLSAFCVQQVLTQYPKPFSVSLVSCTCFTSLLCLPLHPARKFTKTTAARLAPFFIATLYTYNVGLAYTTVSSSSTITTLTTLFALALGAFLGTDPVTIPRITGTVITILGVAIIGADDGAHRLAGDALTLFSALCYALYGEVLKTASSQHAIDVPLVQAYMGLFLVLAGIPTLALLHVSGVEEFSIPSWPVVTLLLLNGFGGTLLAEVLYARCLVLTSPLVSSLAISVSIPLSLAADSFVKNVTFSTQYLVGTVLVLVAFVLINWDMARERVVVDNESSVNLLAAHDTPVADG